MYEENNSADVRRIILRVLFVILLIVLVIWLFPTKSYVNNLIDQKLGTTTNNIMNQNISTMKDGALAYFNGSRLPSQNGKSAKITLGEMLDENLIIEFTDENGKKCDEEASYATVTKNNDDYTLDVNLKCSKKEAHVKSYIECFDGVCVKKKLANFLADRDKKTAEKKNKEDNKSKEKNKKNQTNDSEENKDKNSKESNKSCEYTKNITNTSYGTWSNWSKNYIKKTNNRQVQIKTEKVTVGTTKVPQKYRLTSNSVKVKVTKGNYYQYIYVCPADYNNGGTYSKNVTCYKDTIRYVNKPLYKYVTYYRYRIKNNKSTTDTKWSNCQDKNLLDNGYSLTGNTR